MAEDEDTKAPRVAYLSGEQGRKEILHGEQGVRGFEDWVNQEMAGLELSG